MMNKTTRLDIRPRLLQTYACRARHERLHPVARGFETLVPMVRIELGDAATPDWQTSIGSVLAADHLLYSVADVRARFGEELGRPIARMELITPARKLGSRFSPIALFLGYERASDTAPSFFIVEAGTADGRPEVLYLARHMGEELLYLTGYHPTPLTTAEQIYRSRLTMAAPNEPGELVVEVLSTLESRPHLRICAAFSREAIEAVPLPLAQTVEAAARVMAVARDLGVDVAGPLGRVVGAIASAHLPWGETVEEAPPSSCAA